MELRELCLWDLVDSVNNSEKNLLPSKFLSQLKEKERLIFGYQVF